MGDQVAVITPSAKAGAEALALVEKHTKSGALIFVAPEDLRAQGMFLPEVVVVPASPADFHDMAGGKKMPKSHHVHRMADAGGVVFTENCGTRPGPGEYSRIGWAQGKRRLPDGTWRTSPVLEYEFDPDVRAEEDFLKKPSDYRDETAKRRHIVEFRKWATARASTGAELRVIRHLTGTPTSFDSKDIARAMVFSRIALNTDGMLQAPEMRQAAVAHALGAQTSLFGPQREERNVTPTAEATAEQQPEAEQDPFAAEDPEPAPAAAEETDEQRALREAREKLEEWSHSEIVTGHKVARAEVTAMLAKKDATIQEVEELIRKCVGLQDFMKKRAASAAKAGGGAA